MLRLFGFKFAHVEPKTRCFGAAAAWPPCHKSCPSPTLVNGFMDFSDAWPLKPNLRATLWATADNERVEVVLEEPCDEEECPLTLRPILDDVLEFMPQVTFLLRFPDHKKMTLPCGHSFGAMNLTFYFCQSKLICPCCRRGIDKSLQMDFLPEHFKVQISEEVLKMKQVAAMRSREDERNTLDIRLRQNPDELDVFIDSHVFTLVILQYRKDQVCASCQVLLTLIRIEEEDAIDVTLEGHVKFQAEAEQAKEAASVALDRNWEFSFATYARAPSGIVQSMDATDRFVSDGERREIAVATYLGSRFEVRMQAATSANKSAFSNTRNELADGASHKNELSAEQDRVLGAEEGEGLVFWSAPRAAFLSLLRS